MKTIQRTPGVTKSRAREALAAAIPSMLILATLHANPADAASAGACPLVTDTEKYRSPDIPRPDYLTPYTDPTFGTALMRVTDPGQPIPNPNGHPSLENLTWDDVARHRYSSFAAWNADSSLIAIPRGVSGILFLDGNSYEPAFVADPPGDVRWHPTLADLMIYVGKSEIGFWNPRDGKKKRVYEIRGYSNFKWGRSKRAKGKPTHDGRKAMIIADRAYDLKNVGFIFDLETGKKSEDIDFRQHVTEDDNAGIYLSPLGAYYEVYGCVQGHEDDRCNARIVFDVDGNEMWRETGYHIPGHWDYDVDENGEEWLIGLAKSGDYKGSMIKRSFGTGEIVELMDAAASHTSKRNIQRSSRVALMSRISRGRYKKPDRRRAPRRFRRGRALRPRSRDQERL